MVILQMASCNSFGREVKQWNVMEGSGDMPPATTADRVSKLILDCHTVWCIGTLPGD
jgi:hypothetical protein